MWYLPLFHEKLRIGPLSINVVRLVGSDHTPVSFIVAVKQNYCNQVVDLLRTEMRARWSSWHLLYVGAISGKFDYPDKLMNSFKRNFGDEYQCEMKVTDDQTYFLVASSWEAQIATLAPKQRTNARRAFRETDSKHIRISTQLASNETIAQTFDNFIEMHQKHWHGIGKAGHFGAWPSAKDFHREVAETQLELNRLRLIVINFNGMPVGYEYLYRLHDTYCWFLGARAFLKDFANIDFKWIAFRAKIEIALADGVRTIDGMRGTYDYKILMGGNVMPIRDLFLYSLRFPVKQRVLTFRFVSKVVSIFYHKIWRERVASHLGIKPKTFWENWVRFHQI